MNRPRLALSLWRDHRRKWLPHLAVLALFTLVAVAMTWPLILHLHTSVIGPFRNDNFEYIWKIYWVKHALVDLHRSPWIVPDVYYPQGYQLAYGEITPLHTFWGLPLTLLVGEVASYNLSVLLSTILSGYFTYLWVRRLTDNAAAAILAGLVFAFCPYRMARIAGHLPLVSTQGMPLFLLGAERFVQNRRLRDALVMGLGYAVSALASWYYAVIVIVLGAIYLVARTRLSRSFLTSRATWLGLAVFAASAVLLVGPFTLPYLGLLGSGVAHVPLEMADFWSASVLDFLLPNIRHPLWGRSLQNLTPVTSSGPLYEFILSWGMIPTLLAFYGWRWATQRSVQALRWVILAGLILSLGMTLRLVVGLPIALPVPEPVAGAHNAAMGWLSHDISYLHEPFDLGQASAIVLPLPGLFLRWFVPGFASMRSWGRFAIFVTLAVAALAGLGLDSWYRRELLDNRETRASGRRKLWAATGLFSVILLFEYWVGPQELVEVGPRPVDRWLAQQPGQFSIMQYPIGTALSGDQMLYTQYHGKRIVFGYGAYFPILFRERHPELGSFPSDVSLDQLRNWEVRFVLLDLAALPESGEALPGDIDRDVLTKIVEQPRLQLVGTYGEIQVYRLLP